MNRVSTVENNVEFVNTTMKSTMKSTNNDKGIVEKIVVLGSLLKNIAVLGWRAISKSLAQCMFSSGD